MTFEGFPFVIGWELTLDCNLHCHHCASAAGEPRLHELTLPEALAICDQFPDLLVQDVTFTGGEPLIRPDWFKIAEHLSRREIYTRIITNGLVLGPRTIAQLKDAGIASIGVSFDGLEPTHDYIRGHPGLYRSLLTNIERVLASGLLLAAITTVNALNVDQLPAMLEVLESLGVSQWQMQPLFPLGRGQEATEMRLTDAQYVQFGRFVRGWSSRALEKGLKITPGDSFGYFTELDQRSPAWHGCPAGQVACGITSDGKVKPCLSLPNQFIQGDLRQDDLWTIWFRPNAFAFNREDKQNLGPNCRACAMAEQCLGGCSAMSFGTTGCFHNDPYCFFRLAPDSFDHVPSQQALSASLITPL